MPSAAEHIDGFCRAFIRPEKRDRLAMLLAGKRRADGVHELAHPDLIDMRYAIASKETDPQRLLAHLKKLGAPADCYLISAVDSLDGQTMNLAAALDAVIGIGVGTLVSCVPGKLALYEGEYGASERLILHRG
jgi:hypothetical protein